MIILKILLMIFLMIILIIMIKIMIINIKKYNNIINRNVKLHNLLQQQTNNDINR